MGMKFYRGADKPKKINKRVHQTRSWFRTLKWVACNSFYLSYLLVNLITIIIRSCSSYLCCRTSFQRIMGPFFRTAPSPRSQKIFSEYRCIL